MADSRDLNGRAADERDEELTASSVVKGRTYPKGEEPKEEQAQKRPSKRPPKDLLKDQFTPDDGFDVRNGGWAVFEYPAPDDIEPSVERVREHVEDRLRRAGYEADGEVVAYDKDDDNFRVAIRYK